jgi:hypothetical protein
MSCVGIYLVNHVHTCLLMFTLRYVCTNVVLFNMFKNDNSHCNNKVQYIQQRLLYSFHHLKVV